MDLVNPKIVYKDFKKNKIKNANIIVDLLKELQCPDIKKLRKTLVTIHKIFCLLIRDGDIKYNVHSKRTKTIPKIEFEKWLLDRYKDLHKQLLVLAVDSKVPRAVQEISLVAIIKLLQKEVIYNINKEKVENLSFPFELLENMYMKLLLSGIMSRHLIIKLKEYLQCPDFLFASLSVISDIIPSNTNEDSPPYFLQNTLDLLELIELPNIDAKPLHGPTLFSDDKKESSEDQTVQTSKQKGNSVHQSKMKRNIDGNEKTRTSNKGQSRISKKLLKLSKQTMLEEASDEGVSCTNEPRYKFPLNTGKKYVNSIWESILKMNISSDVYKRCLVILPEKVMMHLDNPVRLTDFFMSAYVQGGIVSILAMHGVFVLITEYNLEYPDFYEKVYALLQPSIFNAKYINKFFQLINIFFMSPYLPEYIVAAFIKKICRLMLTAPSPSLSFMIKFVANLLLRFPSLRKLINSPSITNIENDPYLPYESNLLKCRAGESSLWEIATIKQHPLYGISKLTSFLDRNLPEVELDITKCANDSYNDLHSRASKIRSNIVATTFHKPDSLLRYSEKSMDSWEEL